MRRSILVLSVLLLFVICTGCASTGSPCKPESVEMEGTGNNKGAAKRDAKGRWSEESERVFGESWSHWKCADVEKLGGCYGPVGEVVCTAKAKPCKKGDAWFGCG